MTEAVAQHPWRMPHEATPHERTWMAFPTQGYALGSSDAEAEEARATWAAVANAIIDFEPVTMVVNPGDEKLARRVLSGQVDIVSAPLNDAWMRDMGPTFVVDDTGRLGAVCWTFNGWGAQSWARWDKDSKVNRFVAELAGAVPVVSPLVNEGGGIHVDGRGTVLVTETVQLDPGRNPGMSRAEVEAELARTIGAQQAIWLPRGLWRDAQRFGTRGHVDIVATFTESGRVLYHDQTNPDHPDHEISATIRRTLEACLDEFGPVRELVPVPAPRTLTDAEGPVDYSYINHLLVNGGVVACSFHDARDEAAAEILADSFPGREVVSVDARPLFARGGGIHCITQHQPKAV